MVDFALFALVMFVLFALVTIVLFSLHELMWNSFKNKNLPKSTWLRLRHISDLEDCDINEAIERAILSYHILRNEDDSSMACEESSSVSSESLSLTFSRELK
jgi:hypothetical protein